MAEKKDSIRNLIEQGRRAGKLTSTEISDAMEESSRVIDAEQMEKSCMKSWKATALKWWMMTPLICPLWPIWARRGWMTLRIPLPRTALPSMTPLRFT